MGGNTDLKGGVLASSQAAVDKGKNLLMTGSLTASDLQNKDEHSASGFALSGSVSGKFGDQSDIPAKLTDEQKKVAQADGKPSASGGFGSVSSSQSSITASGISGGAVVITDQDKQLGTGQSKEAILASIDRAVTTESAEASAGSLVKGWDAQQLQKDVDAQVAITQKFSSIAPKEIADFAEKKVKELKDQKASPDEIAKWEEGGSYRVALHTLSGGLSGGLSGALGAGAVAESAKLLDTMQTNAELALVQQGVSPEAAKAMAQSLAQATALAVGAVVGGEVGGATGLATDTNNRQLHQSEKAKIKSLAGGDPKKEARLTAAACALVKCYAEYAETSEEYKYFKQISDLGASDAFTSERAQLSNQKELFTYSTGGFWTDERRDAAKKLNNTCQIDTRLIGAAKLGLGAGGLIASVGTAPAACATGIGCVANGAVAVSRFETGFSGAKEVLFGTPAETYLNKSLQTLGLSPTAAGWMEAIVGLGSTVAVTSATNKAALNQTVQVDKSANVLIDSKDIPVIYDNAPVNASKNIAFEVRTVEDSLVKIDEIRQTLDVGAKRNIAVAEFNINGEVGDLVGINGSGLRSGTVGIPERRRFETIATGITIVH